jgi:hypothetical protein
MPTTATVTADTPDPTKLADEREALARAIWDGWCESNEEWEGAGEMTQLRCFFAADAVLALRRPTPPPDVAKLPRLPRDKTLYGWDYLDDPEGLERLRQSATENAGHDMAVCNNHSLRRLIDTIERLKAALASKGET